MPASPEQLAELQSVNDAVNAIPYEAIGADMNEDEWRDTPVPGLIFECRCYGIRKAMLLEQQGWPAADLSEVLCNDELGEYHDVMAARAGGEVYILDNRAPSVYLWSDPPYKYTWLHIQIPGTDEFRDASGGLT